MMHQSKLRRLQNRLRFGSVVALVCTALLACEGDSRPFEEAAEIESLNLVSINVVPPVNAVAGLIINSSEQVQLGLSGISQTGLSYALPANRRRWATSDPSIISVNENGIVTGRANGSAIVSVTIGDIASAEFALSVNNATLTSINSIEGAENLERCIPAEYYATGLYDDASVRTLSNVSFSLQQSSTATLDNPTSNAALINANTSGALTLTAVVGELTPFERQLTVLDTLQSIVVTPNPVSLDENDNIQFAATGTYTSTSATPTTRDITDQINWFVNESGGGEGKISSVGDNNPGYFKAEEEGTVSVQAYCGLDVTNVGQSVNVTINEEDDDDED